MASEGIQKKCLKLCKQNIILESLESRRKNNDMVETFKYSTVRYKTDPNKLFSVPLRTLRDHSMKLFKPSVIKEVSRIFFPNRVIDQWNALSETAIGATSADTRHLSRISVRRVLAEPRKGVVRSRSQPIIARGSGGAL